MSDKIDLEVKRLLGLDLHPNNCEICRGLYRIRDFEINILDGNVHCAGCHKRINPGRIDSRSMRGSRPEFKMAKLRRKKDEK